MRGDWGLDTLSLCLSLTMLKTELKALNPPHPLTLTCLVLALYPITLSLSIACAANVGALDSHLTF